MASYWHAPLQLYKIWDVAGLDIDQPPSAQPPRRGVGGTRALAHSIDIYIYILYNIYNIYILIYIHTIDGYVFSWLQIFKADRHPGPQQTRIQLGAVAISAQTSDCPGFNPVKLPST